MDRDITIRYYQIVGSFGGLSLANTLDKIHASPLPDRHAGGGGGIVLRLEDLRKANGLLFGDITRVQIENLPSHPTDMASEPLPVTQLGHHAAFCFDPLTNIIGFQFDTKMAIGKLCAYLSSFSGGSKFSYYGVLREDVLEKFENETPTKLKMRVANAKNFPKNIRAFSTAPESRGVSSCGCF